MPGHAIVPVPHSHCHSSGQTALTCSPQADTLLHCADIPLRLVSLHKTGSGLAGAWRVTLSLMLRVILQDSLHESVQILSDVLLAG